MIEIISSDNSITSASGEQKQEKVNVAVKATINTLNYDSSTSVSEKTSAISVFEGTSPDAEKFSDNNTPWQNPSYFSSRWKEYLFILTCMLSNLLNQAGQTQATSTMNVIGSAFNADSSSKTWLMASFPLVSGSFILVSGRIGDIYGLKRTMIGGLIVMIIWSLICGFANYSSSVTFFIICRAFQGLGIAFVLPNVMGLVGNIYKVGSLRKNIVISCIGMCAPTGAAFGAFWAGLIATKAEKQWPWIFYAYAFAGILNLVLAIYSIPDTVPVNVHGFSMDWTGSVVGVIGLILFNFVWNEAPIVGWEKAYIIVLLIFSLLIIVVFFIYEIKFAKSPLLPQAVTHNHNIIMILSAMFMGWGSFGIWTFYYYAFLLNLRGYTPLEAGASHCMFILWGTIAAFTVAFTIKRVGPSVLLFCSMVAFTVGSIMLSITPVHQTYWKMTFGMQIILAFGMDLSFPASSIILSDALPMEYQGMAGSLVNTIVNYSTSLCLGMGTTAEIQVNKNGTDLLKGYRAALYVGIGLGVVGVIIAALFLFESLRQKRGRTAALTAKKDMS
ncbi:hypothetical protein KAFR_0B03930 [Kazachstania africana CBS 2517]|uniref:Major facilitator superfamily (MFS) profile domain-containing protein n=1 Tax=Kazachstania africana (strain ATCC 22294 / BCRC 22015 / CBS 2517 / CECT 1963 / NBRC 1671 / NRRL Y-8276) TaxID=1071382 RepID=H2AQN9_KAZAF|nr:hypothetical protein KAFR_0B03930 [Kazachstania africana CBS 2517]CCF56689.1 hypothetical protein KAFR_0B03930 [Kazachstania africana CBS 2517]